MSGKKINLNQIVKFKLNFYGETVWRNFYKDLGLTPPGVRPPCRMQIWELMQIFGPDTRLGGREHFENLEWELEEK